jgi:hypothetical protein
MTRLRPIIRSDPGARVSRLLVSARIDRPPLAARHKTLAALGLHALPAAAQTTSLSTAAATGTAAGGSTASAAGSVGAALIWKWAAIGMVCGGVASGALVAVREEPQAATEHAPPAMAPLTTSSRRHSERQDIRSAPHEPTQEKVTPACDSGGRSARVSERRSSLPPALRRQRAAPQSESATPGATSATMARQPPPVGTLSTPTQRFETVPELPLPPPLMEEIAAVDRARGELSAGRPSAALAATDEYFRDFVPPRMGPEARLIRIRALLALDRLEEARRLGEQMLARQPDGAHAQRLRSVLREHRKPRPGPTRSGGPK